MLNATLKCHVARPRAISYEVSTFIYILVGNLCDAQENFA